MFAEYERMNFYARSYEVAIVIEVVPGRYGRQGKTRVCSRTQNSTFCTNFDEILEAVRPRNEVLPQGNADVPSRTTAGGFRFVF